MGEMADYYINQEIDGPFFDEIDWNIKPTIPKNIWITKKGQRIKIKNLENSHLLNIIKMLLKKNTIEKLELKCNQWNNLINEADKRGLEWTK